MLELKKITEESAALAAFHKFNPKDRELPAFLFHEPRYEPVVLSLLEDGRQAGLMFGITVPGDTNFYLHHISADRAHADEESLLRLVSEAFQWLRDHYSFLSKVIINLNQEDDREPQIVTLLKKLPGAAIHEVRYIRQVGIKTESFGQLRKFRWYRPDLLEKKGYEAILWRDCDEEEVRKLREAEERRETDADYLSPGIWEEGWDYDPDTSYALVKKGSKKPLGWAVTEGQKGGTAVKIRRYYTKKEERRKLVGHAFGSWMLDRIAERYEVLQYEVLRGNRQMEMFTHNFCRPYLISHYFKCNIIINLTEEEQHDGMDTGNVKRALCPAAETSGDG